MLRHGEQFIGIANDTAQVALDLSDQFDNAAVIVEDKSSAVTPHNGPGYREPLGC